MLFKRLRNNTANQRKLILLGLLSVASLINVVHAADKQATGFATPKALLQAKVETRQQVIDLMKSTAFKAQLSGIARKLDAGTPISMQVREEIALASMLARHDTALKLIANHQYPLSYFHYSQIARAGKSVEKTIERQSPAFQAALKNQLKKQLEASLAQMTDEDLHRASYCLSWSLIQGQDYLLNLFKSYQANDTLSVAQALSLLSNYQLYHVYAQVLPLSAVLVPAEQTKRYVIEPDVLIKTPSGATLSAVVVRTRGDSQKRAAAFQLTIYADEAGDIKTAIHAAAHGYIGVVANTRGKRLSPDEIIPWEHDGEDANAVIDWISKQSWSDGRVAMYGGSYLGFTQWAAAKYMHPALETIVPYSAANPLTGLPIQNNIFITGNYQWAFHVTNNKGMDYSVYSDWQHWEDAYTELFESGRAFKDIDIVEGTPNPWFQKWLRHPDFDSYYQAMLPYQQDYKKINIPVLSITGYFDGAQISAIDFLSRHYKYNANADHTLLIGPYNHHSAQGIPGSHHRNYELDPVALEKDTAEITFQWFDHVLHKQPKPALLKDKVNYQLMGSNTWQHKPSYAELNAQAVSYHLTNNKTGNNAYELTTSSQNGVDYIEQTVDLADRKTLRNVEPWPVIQEQLNEPNGLTFVTAPFVETRELAGAITGYFSLAINKKDVDIGFNFYELNNKGKAFLLTHYISRASYAENMGKRQLLKPNEKTLIPIVNGRMTAKLIEKGNRLAIVLNVNKNQGAQVNMGTGKDVSDETIADAGEPLIIKWYNDSRINIPLKPWNN